MLGFAVGCLGLIPYVAALRLVGIAVVQPLYGFGFIVLLTVSRFMLHEKMHPAAKLAVALLVFMPVFIALILLALWFMGDDAARRESNHRAVIVAAISIGSVCGFVLAFNHLWPDRQHPFQDMPELMSAVDRIFYPIHDPTFPSNTSAVTFTAATSVWQRNHKMGLIILIPAVLMPFAKIVAAVYYPTDVLAGAALGILTSYFIYKVVAPVFGPIIDLVIRILRRLCLA